MILIKRILDHLNDIMFMDVITNGEEILTNA